MGYTHVLVDSTGFNKRVAPQIASPVSHINHIIHIASQRRQILPYTTIHSPGP